MLTFYKIKSREYSENFACFKFSFFIRFWYLDTKKESNEMLPFIHLSNKLIQRSSSMGKRVVYRHEFQLRYLRMLIQGNQPFLQLSLGYHLHRHKS